MFVYGSGVSKTASRQNRGTLGGAGSEAVMDWVQIIQMFCIPAFGYLFYAVGCVRKDLEDFKVEVAKEAKNYATNEAILRMESKIDDLRTLIIEELRPKRAKK